MQSGQGKRSGEGEEERRRGGGEEKGGRRGEEAKEKGTASEYQNGSEIGADAHGSSWLKRSIAMVKEAYCMVKRAYYYHCHTHGVFPHTDQTDLCTRWGT